MNAQKHRASNVLNPAILITGLTGFSYAIAFIFEATSLIHYRLPIQLVNLTLNNILISILAVSIVLIGLFFFLDFSIGNPFKVVSPIGETIVLLIVGMFYGIIRAGLYDSIIQGLIILAIIAIPPLCLNIIAPLIFGKREKTKLETIYRYHVEKLEKDDFVEDTMLFHLMRQYGKNIVLIVILALFLIFLTFDISNGIESSRKVFPVIIQNDINLAVVKFNESNVIAMPFDSESKTISNEFRVLSYEYLSQENITLINKETGKLTLEDYAEKPTHSIIEYFKNIL